MSIEICKRKISITIAEGLLPLANRKSKFVLKCSYLLAGFDDTQFIDSEEESFLNRQDYFLKWNTCIIDNIGFHLIWLWHCCWKRGNVILLLYSLLFYYFYFFILFPTQSMFWNCPFHSCRPTCVIIQWVHSYICNEPYMVLTSCCILSLLFTKQLSEQIEDILWVSSHSYCVVFLCFAFFPFVFFTLSALEFYISMYVHHSGCIFYDIFVTITTVSYLRLYIFSVDISDSDRFFLYCSRRRRRGVSLPKLGRQKKEERRVERGKNEGNRLQLAVVEKGPLRRAP